MPLDEFAHYFSESKISSKQRKKLDDSQFGIPSLRKYPLTDEKHVLQAVRFFNKAPEEHKPELARNIVKRAKELNMDWEKWDVLKPYLDKPVKEAYAKELHSTPEADNICAYLCKSVKYDNASPKTWRLKSPDEVTDHNKGNCHDTAWYVFKNLDAYAKHKVGKGILFFIEYKEGKKEGGQTHSVCYERIPGGICIIECSWQGMTGTFPYNDIEEYISVVKKNWEFTGDNNKLFATEIKNTSQIHPGMTLSEYVFIAMKNKEIITEAYDPTGDHTSGTSDFDHDDDDPDDCYCESTDSNGITNAKLIASRIHEKVQKDSKPPTGNQNCMLCTMCAEAQFRGRTDMPRPVYSPRDPVLNILGESIVIRPRVYSLKSGFDDMLDTLSEHPYARFYCHVKWKNGNGGHEFLIITENGKAYIMDPQQGKVDKFLETHPYIQDLKWDESYLARMDDAKFNETVLRDFNTNESIVPWNAELDIPYMLKEGMITEEEAEQYWKEHPDDAPKDRHFLSYKELDKMSESKNIFTSGDFAKYGKDVDLTDARGPITESVVMEFDHDSEKDLPSNVFTLNEYKKASSYRSLIVGEIHDLSMINFYNKLLSERKPEFFISELVHEDRVLDQNALKAALDMATDGEFKRGVPDYQDNYAIYKLAYDHGCKLIGCDLYDSKHYNRMNDEDADRETFMLKVLEEFENTNFVCQLGDHHLRSIPISKEFLDFCGDTTDDRGIVSDLTVDNASPIWTHFKNSKYVAILREPNELKNELEFTNQQHIQERFVPHSDSGLPDGVWMRPAIKADEEYIFQCEMETLDDKYKNDPKVVNAIRKDARDSVKKTRIICYTDENNKSQTIGLLTAYERDDNENPGKLYWYIGEIYLNLDFRGKGIGKAVLEKEIEQHSWISLDVSKKNKHAIELYLSLGFKIISENEDGYRMDLKKTEAVQEAVWQDIRNGVNPNSKHLWFHVSRSPLNEGKVFKPRIPEYLEKTKQGKDDPYYEDMEIPRVCFSPSISGALHAIIAGSHRIETGGKEFYVYISEKPINEYKRITNKELVDRKLVFDAKYTKECWITEPVKMILFGTIMIDQVAKHKAKPTANGMGEVSDISYKWHWQTKPRVIKGMGHEYFYEPDKKEKKSKKNKPIKEEYTMSDFERDPSVLQMILEAEAEEAKEKEEKEDNDDEKGDAIESETEISIEGEAEIGSDVGDVQNEYNPEEVERINKLINSEMSAVSEYFNAAKESKEPNLMRLFSDIGDEERFHLEQLIYAKSTITGEAYEPQDPKVKKEYQELIDMGLDEETAMTTAIDKVQLMPKEATEDMSEDEAADFEESFRLISTSSLQTAVMLEAAIDTSDITLQISENSSAFLEQMIIMEEVDNLNTRQGQKDLGTKNPIAILIKAFIAIYGAIIGLARKARLAFQKIRLRDKRKWAWIKKHGIGAIFAKGVSFYFFSEKKNMYDVGEPMKYITLIHSMNEAIIKSCNITTISPNKYDINGYTKQLVDTAVGTNREIHIEPLAARNTEDGIRLLQGVSLTKTKVVLTQENTPILEEQFFGYTDRNYAMIEKEGENTKNVRLSVNVYNQMSILLDALTALGSETKLVMEALNNQEGTQGTTYDKMPGTWKSAIRAIGIMEKSVSKFNAAVAADVSEMIKVNNGLKEAMETADTTGDTSAVTQHKNDVTQQQKANADASKNNAEKSDTTASKRTFQRI